MHVLRQVRDLVPVWLLLVILRATFGVLWRSSESNRSSHHVPRPILAANRDSASLPCPTVIVSSSILHVTLSLLVIAPPKPSSLIAASLTSSVIHLRCTLLPAPVGSPIRSFLVAPK